MSSKRRLTPPARFRNLRDAWRWAAEVVKAFNSGVEQGVPVAVGSTNFEDNLIARGDGDAGALQGSHCSIDDAGTIAAHMGTLSPNYIESIVLTTASSRGPALSFDDDGSKMSLLFDADTLQIGAWNPLLGPTAAINLHVSAPADSLKIDVSGDVSMAQDLAVTGTISGPVGADFIDAITEIASGLKSGSDGTLVTGTAGSDGQPAQWNADGDVVGSDFVAGDLDRVWLTPADFVVDDGGDVALSDGNIATNGSMERLEFQPGGGTGNIFARATFPCPVEWRSKSVGFRYLWSGDGADTTNTFRFAVSVRYHDSGDDPTAAGTSVNSAGATLAGAGGPALTEEAVAASGSLGASALTCTVTLLRSRSNANDTNTGELWFHGIEVKAE